MCPAIALKEKVDSKRVRHLRTHMWDERNTTIKENEYLIALSRESSPPGVTPGVAHLGEQYTPEIWTPIFGITDIKLDMRPPSPPTYAAFLLNLQ